MRPPAWILESGTVRLARVGVAVDIGGPSTTEKPSGEGTPLLDEPLVVTHDDAMQYVSTIDDLVTCLDADAREALIYQNPGKLRADAENRFTKATAADGCAGNPYLCPHPDEDPKPTTPSEIKNRVIADALRKEGFGYLISAEAMDKRAADRGLKNDVAGNVAINNELSFYASLRSLAADVNRTRAETSSATIVGSSDWKKIALLDVRYQTLRDRYVALGFSPSCAIPRLAGAGGLATWLKIVLVILGIGVGAYAIGQASHLLGARP